LKRIVSTIHASEDDEAVMPSVQEPGMKIEVKSEYRRDDSRWRIMPKAGGD
jgi:hypothetical protein